MNTLIIIITFLCSISSRLTHAEESIDKVDFKSIKKILKNDRLEKVVERKKKRITHKKRMKRAENTAKFNLPSKEDFWGLYSELWLVQNATILKWNKGRPDYGLTESFKELLEKQGVFQFKFKILTVDSPDIYHMALPSNQNEVIFLMGLPFMKALDLSRLEISLLLFENYLRHKYGHFRKSVETKELDKFIGGNFKGKVFPKKTLEDLSSKYDEVIFDKGFNFTEQFQVTKDMGNILKSDMSLWNTYYRLIRKIDKLVKSDILFRKYVKIFPSPELQLNWLSPIKKKIL